MKTRLKSNLFKAAAVLFIAGTPALLKAQQVTVGERMQNMRAYDKSGINVFEAPKEATSFDGMKFNIGAGFTQGYQGLKHENDRTTGASLYHMSPGFNNASANLMFDAQLADGIRLNLTSYLSSRHHNETWVKAGYIQFDKLPFKGQFWDDLMKNITLKVGHMEINYGDAHFRRSDGGSTMYNPFAENYIMDSFTTEIGAEIYVSGGNGLFGMIGATGGTIRGTIDSTNKQTAAAPAGISKMPSFLGKVGYDKQVDENLRVRFAASVYHNNAVAAAGNTLFGGDRTGSNYFMVMEANTGTYSANAFSGRFDPGFKRKITTAQFNGFVKYSGLEVFGTYEVAKGRAYDEATKRDANQYAVEGIYRFGSKENLFVGARYNAVKADVAATADVASVQNDVKIDRATFAAGWFLTNNILLKGEYVTQKYKDFNAADIRHGGKFNGYVIQAVVGF
ncbi:hypothetical protein [Arcticibacter tournemirensis]|uniref:Porin n=1 Tax=Arcticibacter tournemirensis TaxID=699437 RepID=A0A4Q0ME21_9SPHI|nr:hypothetical protein [Arcticibacter tournemirensis]RXF71667.1 hypothetical protein EKH83_02980 [Arcticibacter tournemirensis]